MMNSILSAPSIDFTNIPLDDRLDAAGKSAGTHPWIIYIHHPSNDYPLHAFATEEDAVKAWDQLERVGAKSLAYIGEMTVYVA